MFLEKKVLDFEKTLKKSIFDFGPKNKLRDAVEYALLSGGKRLRPLIVYMVAEALNKGFDVSFSALAVEFFHTASLIADDLPCMDNECERRGKKTLHQAFDESVALLASYTLISAGYEMLFKNAEVLAKTKKASQERAYFLCTEALREVSKIAGIKGATGGQFLDLFPPKHDLPTILEIIDKKTAVLFELAFVLGYLFGGGKEEKLEDIKTCAKHLGMAFQIADDLSDLKQDEKNGDVLNLALMVGEKEAQKLFDKEIYEFQLKLKKLGLETPAFKRLVSEIKALI